MTGILDNLPDNIATALEELKTGLESDNLSAHGERIFRYLDTWLLDDEQQQTLRLRPWNYYFLYAAAHLYSPVDPDKKVTRDTIFKTISNRLGMSNPDQANILVGVCRRWHSTDDGQACRNDNESTLFQGAPVNIDLIAAAVRLAALFDLKRPDTLEAVIMNLSLEEKISPDLASKAIDVTFLGPHAFLPGTIRVCITCRHPEIHRALKHHENKLQQMLHLTNGQISPRFLYSEILFEIEPDGYTPMDMKFTVDSMAALTLLTGNRLYSDRRVFLRELIQNAVDACNLKKIFTPDYSPQISVDFDGQTRIITFQDNGVGMDRQWIEKYFLKIGISFYRSGDLKNINQGHVDFNFISKFGIGFLSSFMVSDKIVVQTRKKNDPGLLITISNLQDYFDVRLAPKECPPGTRVTLYLKETTMSYSRAMEFICYLKTNIRFLSIPVALSDHEGKEAVLGHEKLIYTHKDGNGCEFVSKLGFTDSEGYLFLKTKRNFDNLYALESAKGGISIFQDGIFVTQTASLLPEGARQNVIGRINLTGKDRCELSMDRNRVFWTEAQLQAIKRIIQMGIVDLARQVLVDTAGQTPPLTFGQSLVNHLAIFFDFNDINDEMYQKLPGPVQKIVAKRFRDFVRVHFAHTRDKNHVPDADGYGEKWQHSILTTFAQRSRPPLPDS